MQQPRPPIYSAGASQPRPPMMQQPMPMVRPGMSNPPPLPGAAPRPVTSTTIPSMMTTTAGGAIAPRGIMQAPLNNTSKPLPQTAPNLNGFQPRPPPPVGTTAPRPTPPLVGGGSVGIPSSQPRPMMQGAPHLLPPPPPPQHQQQQQIHQSRPMIQTQALAPPAAPLGSGMMYPQQTIAPPPQQIQQMNHGMPSIPPPLAPPPAVQDFNGGPFQGNNYQQVRNQHQPLATPQPQVQASFFNPDFQCPSNYTKLTVDSFPATASVATQCGIPLGGVIQPLAPDVDGRQVPVINFGSGGVVRCKKCRAYVNPFVVWLENGRRWRCNLCGQINDTSSQYYSHLDANGERADLYERPELSSGIVEIIAPSEYMLRQPVPPAYVFCIDVGFESVASGLLKCAIDAIKASLNGLGGGGERTDIGIITFDHAVHFYNLNREKTLPQMLVVSDVEELFLPTRADDLLVNLNDSRAVIEKLLDGLPALHANTRAQDSCAGTALNAAFHIMQNNGGRLFWFTTKIPNVGDGRLTPRDNGKLLGSENEKLLLQGAIDYYKLKAQEFSKQQICVDIFAAPQNHSCDLATISSMARLTSGQVHYFPGFNLGKDGERLFTALQRSLTRTIAWEAVMRIRATNGIRVNSYGNFFVRGSDLLQIPNCDSDESFGFELLHEENFTLTSFITIQAALLYTTSEGQRRIRVTTQCIPATHSPQEIVQGADENVISFLLAKIQAEVTLDHGPEEARKRLAARCGDIIRGCRYAQGGASNMGIAPPISRPGMPSQQQQVQNSVLPESLQNIPAYILSLIKSPAFRGGTDLIPDERIVNLLELCRMPIPVFRSFVYPKMYSVLSIQKPIGDIEDLSRNPNPPLMSQDLENVLRLKDRTKRVVIPYPMSLTAQNMDPTGVFVVDCGTKIQMWIGRAVPSQVLQSIFGVPSLDKIDSSILRLVPKPGDDDFKTRVLRVIKAIQESRDGYFPPLEVFREGDPREARFYWNLIEDRASFTGGAVTLAEFTSQFMR